MENFRVCNVVYVQNSCQEWYLALLTLFTIGVLSADELDSAKNIKITNFVVFYLLQIYKNQVLSQIKVKAYVKTHNI